MLKFIQLDDHFATGEPTVQAVMREVQGRYRAEKCANEKFASPAFDYIKGINPEPGCTIVLVNALGAYETYDSNRNGDGFPAKPYRVGVRAPAGKPNFGDGLNGWIDRDEILTRHYETFESGGIYTHHVNKDSSKSLGQVLKAFWNDRMQRVELLLKLYNTRNPELAQRINSGEFPAVSMGCRVKWDVCSRCGNRAPTRKEYCDHLAFGMNEVGPDGVRDCAINPSPHFFDISFVVRPADKTGYMLKKVADSVPEIWTSAAILGEKVAIFERKQAAVRKLGDLQKLIGEGLVEAAKTEPDLQLAQKYRDVAMPGNVQALPPAGPDEIAKMAGFPLSVVLGTLAKHGAFLSTGELAKLLFKQANITPTDALLDKIVLAQANAIEALALYPTAHEKLGKIVESNPSRASSKLATLLGGWLQKRGSVSEYLQQRLHEPGDSFDGSPMGPGYMYNAQAPAKSDMFTMTDPNTGQVYKTTRGASQLASQTNDRALLGGTALLGAAYTAGLSVLPGVKHLPLAARAALGGLGGYASTKAVMTRMNQPYHHLQYQTDQGPVVAGNTEFVKSSTFLDKLAFDFVERLGHWPANGNLNAALIKRAGAPAVSREKVAQWLAPLEENSFDPFETQNIPIHHLSTAFGNLLTYPAGK